MKSKVYYIPTANEDSIALVEEKLRRLLFASAVLDCIGPEERAAVKMHFGEQGNTGYVKPALVRSVCERIKEKKGIPFLAETNTLYAGRRINTPEHLKLAAEHGFSPETIGVDIIIPDDTHKDNIAEVEVKGGTHVKQARICRLFREVPCLVGIAHFKGHLMTGFGGALKNIGMGCATREGKLQQHSELAPFVVGRKCVGCKACAQVCLASAISFKDNKAVVDSTKCIGCASCIAACGKYHAIDLNWEAGGAMIQQKMTEYASAVMENKKGKAAFINFCIKITKECDCLAKDDPRIVQDLGIFSSSDPVALDKACYDRVIEAAGKDIFKEAHPNRNGMLQLEHAQSLGLGSMDYGLIEVK